MIWVKITSGLKIGEHFGHGKSKKGSVVSMPTLTSCKKIQLKFITAFVMPAAVLLSFI